jgi:hypothetical protein
MIWLSLAQFFSAASSFQQIKGNDLRTCLKCYRHNRRYERQQIHFTYMSACIIAMETCLATTLDTDQTFKIWLWPI